MKALYASRFRYTILLLALALGACSAPQLAYNKLDWLAAWELKKYVQLTPDQKQRYNRDFERLWDWHRKNELQHYVADMRALSDQMSAPLSSEQILWWMRRADGHWNRSADQLAPVVCAQLASFSDSQVGSILRRIDHNIEEQTEEFLEPDEEEVRGDSKARLIKRLRRWSGPVDDYQTALIHQWSMERNLGYAGWIAGKKAWRHEFADVLAQRQQADFCHRLNALFVRRPESPSRGLSTRNDRSRAQWAGFLSRMTFTMSDAQREHMQRKLLELADDFEQLAEK